MNQSFRWIASIALLTAISQTAPSFAVTNRRAATGQIVQIQGEVKLLRSRDRALVPTLGTTLYANDQLIAASGAQVKIQCADLSIQTVKAGAQHANPCQSQSAAQQANKCPGLIECPHRGDTIARHNPAIPAIVSPRRTAILADQPTLRWQAVPGTSEYIVRVDDATTGESLWQATTPNTTLEYAGPPLPLGGRYWLMVETNTGKSSLDESVSPGAAGLHFTRLDTTEAEQLETEAARLRSQDWPTSAKTLALANLYRDNNLVTAAIDQLETLCQDTTETAPLRRQLGDLYWRTLSIAPQANEHYAKALTLVNPDDLEERAAILDGLGQTYLSLGQPDQATPILQEAIQLYQSLGNRDRAKVLRSQLP